MAFHGSPRVRNGRTVLIPVPFIQGRMGVALAIGIVSVGRLKAALCVCRMMSCYLCQRPMASLFASSSVPLPDDASATQAGPVSPDPAPLGTAIRTVFLLVWLLVGLLLSACGSSMPTDAVVPQVFPTVAPTSMPTGASTHTPGTMPTGIPALGPAGSGIRLHTEGAQAEIIYQSRLRSPEGVTIGPDGALYIADWLAHRVMRLTRDGDLGTEWQVPSPGDGSAGPRDVAFDAGGSMYVATPSEIFKVASAGGVEQLVTGLCCVSKIEFGPDGNLYFANEQTNEVLLMQPVGLIERVVGGLDHPFDVAFSPAGDLYVSEFDGDILRINTGGTVSVFAEAGLGSFDPHHMAFDDLGNLYVHGNGTLDKFDTLGNRVDPGVERHVLGFPKSNPGGIAFDRNGYLYVADSPNAKIVRITPESQLEILVRGFNPNGLALGSDGNIYAASSADFPQGPGELWRITPAGDLTVVAQFRLDAPQAIAADRVGNVYVSLVSPHGTRVVRMSPNGELEDLFTGPDHYGTLAAGKDGDLYVSLPNEGEIHYADGRGALRPFAQGLSRGDVHDFTLAVSSQGVLYAADSNSGSILRFNSDGSHSVVANVPSLFELPNALVVGPDGILFVQTGRIPLKLYRILPTGAKGLVASNVWGDPLGLALDTRGNLYVSRGGTLDRLSGLMVP